MQYDFLFINLFLIIYQTVTSLSIWHVYFQSETTLIK